MRSTPALDTSPSKNWARLEPVCRALLPLEESAAGKPSPRTLRMLVDALLCGDLAAGGLQLFLQLSGAGRRVDLFDDGRGLDPRQLKSVAVSRGVLTQEEADRLSDAEAQALIFRPGFSTAAGGARRLASCRSQSAAASKSAPATFGSGRHSKKPKKPVIRS